MMLRIENVNEENEVYGDPVEITFVPDKQWAQLNVAVHGAIAALNEFPNDSVRITVVES
jgi:hypothetical protein